MLANSDLKGIIGAVVGIIVVIGWLAFVVVYPMTWRPRVESFTVPAGHQALSLKLPDNGPLRLMIKENSELRLAMEPPPPQWNKDKDNRLGVVDATLPMPANRFETDATVLANTCLSADRQSDCWAVLSVSERDAPVVLSAGRVWVLVTRP